MVLERDLGIMQLDEYGRWVERDLDAWVEYWRANCQGQGTGPEALDVPPAIEVNEEMFQARGMGGTWQR